MRHPRPPRGVSASITCSFALALLLPLPTAPAAPTGYEPAKAALEERLAGLRKLYADTDWAATSPVELGRRLNRDPQACAAFLRRAVRYEPYAGVLRGGSGALAAGAGNSADLCLLLREMLAGAEPKPTFRFATAELDVPQASKLVDAAIARPAGGEPVVAAAPGRPAANAAEPRPATGAAPDPQRAASVVSLLGHVQADLEQIEEVFQTNRDLPVPDPNADHNAAVMNARRHVWLQVQRDGKWETLDPVAALPLPEGAQTRDELPAD